MAKKTNKKDLEIKILNVDDLIEAEYNPRFMSDISRKEILDSINSLGMILPLVVNSYPDRENIIVGGHQRLKIWKELGNKTVPCSIVYYDLEKEKEANIRLNKAQAEWDWFKLEENYEKQDLIKWGFNQYQFNTIHFEESDSSDGLSQNVETPKIPTEYLAFEIMVTADQKKEMMRIINEVKKQDNLSNGDALYKIVTDGY